MTLAHWRCIYSRGAATPGNEDTSPTPTQKFNFPSVSPPPVALSVPTCLARQNWAFRARRSMSTLSDSFRPPGLWSD